MAIHQGTGDINIDAQGVTVTTMGARAIGVDVLHQGAGDINIDVKDSTVTTIGENSRGIYGVHRGVGNVNIDAQGVTVTTAGVGAQGVVGIHQGLGNVNIKVKDGAITTTGNNAHGIEGYQESGMGGSIDIRVNGGTILASGMDANGVQVGRINSETNAVESAAEVGDDGYRRQSVTVNGRVFGGTSEGGCFPCGRWQGHHWTERKRWSRIRGGHSRCRARFQQYCPQAAPHPESWRSPDCARS